MANNVGNPTGTVASSACPFYPKKHECLIVILGFLRTLSQELIPLDTCDNLFRTPSRFFGISPNPDDNFEIATANRRDGRQNDV